MAYANAAAYLAHYVGLLQAGGQHHVRATYTTVQASVPGSRNAGIASYGVQTQGAVIGTTGLSFPGMQVLYSDRGTATGPGFDPDQADTCDLTLTPSNDHVNAHLNIHNATWGGDTPLDGYLEQSSGLLVFLNAPGAGPNAPRAIVTLSLNDYTGTRPKK